jgi:phenylalanyl-tRNA synthetase beta chain
MRLNLNWLKQYVDIDISAYALAEALTMAGLEVESVEKRYAPFDHVVVARIRTIEPHPRSDHLVICQVDTGSLVNRVVCGAPNLYVGQGVPLALPGARLPNGMMVSASTIRGELSEGMLCAEDELGLSEDHSGIMILESELPLGMELYQALGLDDYILEISVTPNRADCLSILGIARDAAAVLGKKLRYPDIHLKETLPPIEEHTSVQILSPEGCPRYAARLLADVTIAPAPFWIREKLIAGGFRPINNVVDVTNFVLLEMGQPLHAFDFDRLEENRIIVRMSEEGERFTTLDKVEHILPARSLMICDGKKPVALAGVMGGMNSEIHNSTTRVLIESACFDPTTIRRTSKNLNISTEASYRFERGTDPTGVIAAVNRAAQLMARLSGGKIYQGIIDEYPRAIPRAIISTNTDRVNRFLGTYYSTREIADCLRSIELEVDEEESGELTVVPPSFRMDLSREVDLFEEVARLKGFHTIPATLPAGAPVAKTRDFSQKMRQQAKELAKGMGFLEIISYSFISANATDLLNLPSEDPRRRSIPLLNALSEELAVMRTTLLPDLLTTARKNMAHKNLDLKIFELGKVFMKRDQDEQADEPYMFSGIWTGQRDPHFWLDEDKKVTFYDIKGAVEGFLEIFGLASCSFVPVAGNPLFQDGQAALLLVEDEEMGILGKMHDRVVKNHDLEVDIYAFDLHFDRLITKVKPSLVFRPLPKYPAVARDLAVVVDAAVSAGSILRIVEDFSRKHYIEAVSLFDVYQGEQIGHGKVSLAYRMVYRAPDKSLTDKEVNEMHEKLVARVLEVTGGTLRI